MTPLKTLIVAASIALLSGVAITNVSYATEGGCTGDGRIAISYEDGYRVTTYYDACGNEMYQTWVAVKRPKEN